MFRGGVFGAWCWLALVLHEARSLLLSGHTHLESDSKLAAHQKPKAPTVVIGGFGDSGTRGAKAMLDSLGLRMCSKIFEETGDNLPTAIGIQEGTREHIAKMLANGNGEVSLKAYRNSKADFKAVLEAQKQGVAQTYRCLDDDSEVPWGFKNPWQLAAWPVTEFAFKNETKLIAVMRDPRDVCTSEGDNSYMDYLCDAVLGKRCRGERDCYSFWAKFHASFVDHYSSAGNVKLVRIEDLVMPEPTEQKPRASVKCLLDFIGLPSNAGAIKESLGVLHEHVDAYMGHHYKASAFQRFIRTTITRFHSDPTVQATMSRFGYDPKAFHLMQHDVPIMC